MLAAMDRSLVLGALGGAGAALVVWGVASRLISKQLEDGASTMTPLIATSVRTEVPPAVRAELTRTLNEYGFTPETGRQISSLLAYGDRLGVL